MKHRSMYEIPKTYNKPHKFFEKYLDNDLDKMSNFLLKINEDMNNATLRGVSPLGSKRDTLWMESGSVPTVKWTEYNVFQFYTEEIYNVYSAVKDLTLDACDYYGVDFKKQKYYIQGWFNVNDRKVGKLDWHDHGGPWAPFWHGYYCIKAEPSSTFYKMENKDELLVENHNKNNRLILSEMGHPHAMGNWDWDGPRITLAYDVTTLERIGYYPEHQHYIPLV